MNTLVYLTVCAFLCIVRAEYHHFNGHFRHSNLENRVSAVLPNPEEHCVWVCDDDNPSGSLTIYYKINIVASFNATSNIAVIISETFVLIVDSKNGHLYITEDASVFFKVSFNWSSSEKFETFFEKVDVEFLKKLWGKRGEKTDVTAVWPNSQKTIETIKETSFRSHLSILYKSKGSFQIKHDLKWFVNVNSALIDLIKSSPELSKAVASTKIDLASIFQSSNGLELLINFLLQIGGHVNISAALPQLLSNPQELLKIAQKLSGGSTDGLNGWINLVAEIIAIVRGGGSVEAVFSAAINFRELGKVDFGQFRSISDKLRQLAEIQEKKYHNSAAFKPILRFVAQISHGSVVVDGFNISDLLKLLPQGPISFVSRLLKRFGGIFGQQHGIPNLFSTILNLLNSTNSVDIAHGILPGLDVRSWASVSSKNGSSVLQQIFHGRNISQILGSNGDIVKQLSSIPILGQVIQQISGGLGGGGNLSHFLSNNSIANALQKATKTWVEAAGSIIGDFVGIIPEFSHQVQSIFGGDTASERHWIDRHGQKLSHNNKVNNS